MVTVDASGDLMLAIASDPLSDLGPNLPPALARTGIGEIFEWRPQKFAAEIARRVTAGGVALIIDYGHVKSATGDTLQAVRSHRYVSPLTLPGATDLTAHVDFEALAKAAQEAGARVHGPVEQGSWLRRLGIEARAAVLQTSAAQSKRADIAFSAPAIVRLPGFAP